MSRTSLFLSVFLLISRWGWAGDERLAVLELRFVAIPPAVQDQIRSEIQQALAGCGYAITTEHQANANLRRAGVPPGCTVGPCIARVGSTLKVDRALVGGISGQGTSYDITLTMLETNGGTVLAQVNSRCDVCNFMEVQSAAAKASVQLHRQTLVFLSRRGTLVVESEPSAADVLLDGLPAGKTPFKRILTPGPHAVEVALEDHTAVSRRVELTAGKTETVRAKLIPRLAASLTRRRRRPVRARVHPWIKWVLLGTGAVVGGLGGGLLALDGTEKADPRYVHDTRTGGVTMITLGAAAAVTAGLVTAVELWPTDSGGKAAALDAR